jgi:hypothetical protein
MEKHGEAYARYHRAVPALLPTIHPFPERASAGWSSDRMLRNREHWMAIGVLAISLFLLWRAYSIQGDELGQESPAAGPPAEVAAPAR